MSPVVFQVGAKAAEDGQTGTSVALQPPLQTDAETAAEDLGLSDSEALAALQRQTRVGELEAFLTSEGPARFGGIYVDYQPYRLTILSSKSALALSQDVDAFSTVVDAAGYADLLPFITLRQVSYSSESLVNTIERVEDAAGRIRFEASGDIRQGTVAVWADTNAKAATLEVRVEADELLASQPVEVVVAVADLDGNAESDTIGGMSLQWDTDPRYCTTGFVVREIAGTRRGVTTAGHCPSNMTDELGNDLGSVFGSREDASHDVQWHSNPPQAYPPQFRAGPSTVRDVSGVVDRANQTVGAVVCKHGAATGKTCGYILSKTYDFKEPGFADPSRNYAATWILVGDSNRYTGLDDIYNHVDMSSGGDSGAPYFVAGKAYGIHYGEAAANANDAVYMAQDYMRDLGIKVRVVGE